MPNDLTPEVLELASRYYSQYSLAELVETGKEVNIPAELIELAYLGVKHRRERRRALVRLLAAACAAISAGTLLWGSLIYNSLQVDLMDVNLARLQVRVQEQRKADLIPKLTQLASQNAALATALSKSSEQYSQAATPVEKKRALEKMDEAIAALSSQTLMPADLKYEIIGVENRLSVERRRFNAKAIAYNQKLTLFPNNLVARFLRFKEIKME